MCAFLPTEVPVPRTLCYCDVGRQVARWTNQYRACEAPRIESMPEAAWAQTQRASGGPA